MTQLVKLEKVLGSWPHLPYDLELAESKLKCTLLHGLRVKWYYKDDVEHCQIFDADPREESQYHGIVLAKPDIEGRGQLYIPDCILVVDSYPCEKENPRVDYVALGITLSDESLVEMFASHLNTVDPHI